MNAFPIPYFSIAFMKIQEIPTIKANTAIALFIISSIAYHLPGGGGGVAGDGIGVIVGVGDGVGDGPEGGPICGCSHTIRAIIAIIRATRAITPAYLDSVALRS